MDYLMVLVSQRETLGLEVDCVLDAVVSKANRHFSALCRRQQIEEVSTAKDSHQHTSGNLDWGQNMPTEAVGRQQQDRAAECRGGKQDAVALPDQTPGKMRRSQPQESNV